VSLVLSTLLAINGLHLISLGESKFILSLTDPNSPLPPIPENKTLSHELELLFKTGKRIECSTREGIVAGIRNGLIGDRYRWTTFTVYINSAYNTAERTLINNAMARLQEAVPCISFLIYPADATPSGDYVHIAKQTGCWSYVGKRGGAQILSLQSPGCMSVGTIIHELIHALGFYHEQSRSDRDDFVNIHWENIQSGTEHNFQKYSPSQVNSYGVPYNQRSIMHYFSTAFSTNGRPTISGKNGLPVGTTGELQPSDIEKLRKMYNCS